MSKNLLPAKAQEELKCYVDITKKGNSIDVVEDPKVIGAYAIKVNRQGYEFHLLWSAHHQDLEEVEFDSWPPTSGEPQFSF
jgi:hypothetical protein